MKGIELVFLLIGGMIGVYLRYRMTGQPATIGSLPVNVLLVNILGSFMLGAFSILAISWSLDAKYALLVAVGFCGSFTTMSSFALDTVNLIDHRQIETAIINIFANISLSIAAVIAGRTLINTLLELLTLH
ncbi:MAG: fluoride efflux transporter CrcB [Thaumarchaeota archaeon]|nr:fluoride efflux transporter CrcB [Nitrososphaerota archaeon]MCL5318215.1 fluoride efflux transporter CrcB [Nitrososphaerota archaeon]